MSWNLGLIGREAARVAGAPMTVAYGPADHAYEVAASAEGPVGRGGRSRPIASFGLFHAITVGGKGLTPFPTRGSAIASPSENLIETRFALDRERPRRTGRDAGSTGRHRPGTSLSRLPAADEVPKGPQ
jgi:hypothetical protein